MRLLGQCKGASHAAAASHHTIFVCTAHLFTERNTELRHKNNLISTAADRQGSLTSHNNSRQSSVSQYCAFLIPLDNNIRWVNHKHKCR